MNRRVLIFASNRDAAEAAADRLGLEQRQWKRLDDDTAIRGLHSVTVHITKDAGHHPQAQQIVLSLLTVARYGYLELYHCDPDVTLTKVAGIPVLNIPHSWPALQDEPAAPAPGAPLLPPDEPLADWEIELLRSQAPSPALPPPPGSFGLSRIGGWVGALVAAGQAVLLDGSRYTHAFVVVDGGYVVQAMPHGAELAPLADYLGRDDVVFTDAPVQLAIQAHLDWIWEPDADLTAAVATFERNLRAAIAAHARSLVGTPYSFADYLALAAVRLGLPSRALRRYVASSGRMICSQLVDAVYCRSGVHLFDDGRPSMDVTPGDLDAWRVHQLEQPAATR